jgi:hypothetical protein
MAELDFPTKLIRLTKATLAIVKCCVKLQNDCETRQGLRLGDVLSTLLFNLVLEAIVRRAKLKTTDTILTLHWRQKTKHMIAAGNRTILDAEQTVALNDKNFEGVNEFMYLRTLVTSKNNIDLEIQRRDPNS